MAVCISFLESGLDLSKPHIKSRNAIEIWDFCKKNGFSVCVTNTGMPKADLRKLGNWILGNRCPNATFTLDDNWFG